MKKEIYIKKKTKLIKKTLKNHHAEKTPSPSQMMKTSVQIHMEDREEKKDSTKIHMEDKEEKNGAEAEEDTMEDPETSEGNTEQEITTGITLEEITEEETIIYQRYLTTYYPKQNSQEPQVQLHTYYGLKNLRCGKG